MFVWKFSEKKNTKWNKEYFLKSNAIMFLELFGLKNNLMAKSLPKESSFRGWLADWQRSIGNKLKYATIKSLNCEFVSQSRPLSFFNPHPNGPLCLFPLNTGSGQFTCPTFEAPLNLYREKLHKIIYFY